MRSGFELQVALTVVYRFAPCREDAHWNRVVWGSVIAARPWLGGSLPFSYCVQNFGSYGKTYVADTLGPTPGKADRAHDLPNRESRSETRKSASPSSGH